MKRWLSPWVLPPVLLGSVLLVTRPVAGAVWLVTSVVVVRLLNAYVGERTPLVDDPFTHAFEDRDKFYFKPPQERYVRKPS